MNTKERYFAITNMEQRLRKIEEENKARKRSTLKLLIRIDSLLRKVR